MTDDDDGRAPAQVVVRLMGLVALALAVAALLGSLDDIRRYARMKRM